MANERRLESEDNPYKGLKLYLDSLVEDYKIHVVVKDFVGFLENGRPLYEALKEYIIHKSSYCMAIKENHRLWKYCLYSKELIYKKLKEEPVAYVGQCYGGVVEYVIPIIHSGDVIGAITVTCGKLDKKSMQKILDRFHGYYGTDSKALYTFYQSSNKEEGLNSEALCKRLTILAEYIGMIYVPHKLSKAKLTMPSKAPETYIMSHALAYIQSHYREDIRLAGLAKYCHCSTSYMSHHFKEYTGVTMKTYVNKLRVAEGKSLLREEAPLSITQIAYELGYKDSNYFSKVFKDIEGISPIVYRDQDY